MTGRLLFSVLLRFYPRGFRIEYGPAMREMFEARMDRARGKSLGAVMRLWLATAWDMLGSGIAERWTSFSELVGAIFEPAGAGADLRHSVRRLGRAPGFAGLTVLLLSIGIAGNVALFSLADMLLFQAPPGIGEPDRVVEVMGDSPDLGALSLSYPEFQALRDEVDAWEAMAVWEVEPVAVVEEGVGRRMLGMFVSGEYFEAMGIRPNPGRGFGPSEADVEGGPRLAVISDRYWRTSLDADPDVLGRSILVNRVPHTVIGVTPPDFGFLGPVEVDLWLPLSAHPNFSPYADRWQTSWIEGVARLRDGVDPEEVAGRAATVVARVREEAGVPARNWGYSVNRVGTVPGSGRTIVSAFLALLMLFGLLALVVLCANVGGMVLARGMAREREIAVRLALGAGRGRVVRQFLAESTMLAVLGAGAGVWMAFSALGVVRDLARTILPVPVTIGVEAQWTVYLFAMSVALVTVLVTGLVPALRLVGPNLVEGLKGDGGGGGSRSIGGLRRLLVSGQVAASTLLLVVAALFLRALQTASEIEPGFQAEGAYTTALNLEAEGYGDVESSVPVLEMLAEAVGADPGIEAASYGSDLPMDLSRSTTSVQIEGAESDTDWIQVDQSQVGPGYFEVLRIPLLEGRAFHSDDRLGTELVAVVNEDAAERLWPGESALGKPVRISMGDRPAEWHTVVGVVGDVLNETAADPIRPMVYGAYAQHWRGDVEFVFRVRSAEGLAGRLRSAIRSVDPQFTEVAVRPLTRVAALGTLPQRIAGGVAGTFGVLTIVLAVVGLYGTIAFEVGRRTREIGVRMALGAGQRSVMRGIVLQTARLALPGLLLGLLAAYGVARLAYAILLGVPSGDPVAFGGVGLLLVFTIGLASWVPAVRASRVDPAEALRCE